MKQTPVEWLEEQINKFHNWKLNPIFDENCFDEIELLKAIQQAKEMENQQKCYSEKEVVELNLRYLQELGKQQSENGHWINFKEWFEKFKNK